MTRIVGRLRDAYPDATCALTHRDPFQLLVATILSAQCTDARVNMVTPALFARFPDASAMSGVDQEELESIIRSTGFYRNKAKSIRGASARIVEAFDGRVPDSMEALLTLPGVARKTANVVLGTAYGLAVGIVVDTHVDRIAKRLGWSRGANPEAVERDLMTLLPRSDWIDVAHLLIFHGRAVCVARSPRCPVCPVRGLCPSASLFERAAAKKTRVAARTMRAAAAKRRAVPGRSARGAAGKRRGPVSRKKPARPRARAARARR